MGKNKSPFEPKKATYFSPLNISHAMMKQVEKMILRSFVIINKCFYVALCIVTHHAKKSLDGEK